MGWHEKIADGDPYYHQNRGTTLPPEAPGIVQEIEAQRVRVVCVSAKGASRMFLPVTDGWVEYASVPTHAGSSITVKGSHAVLPEGFTFSERLHATESIALRALANAHGLMVRAIEPTGKKPSRSHNL